MFTGLVQYLGKVTSISPAKHGLRLSILLPKSLPRIKPGSSLAINGVCLTTTRKQGRRVAFDVIPETVRATALTALKQDSQVNIELPLRAGGELGGHFVLGHVDGVGIITTLRNRGPASLITIMSPKSLMRFIVPKGSITIDGVSLTVARVKHDAFSIALIPFTLQHTNLGTRVIGDRVNIEIDIIARYLKRLV